LRLPPPRSSILLSSLLLQPPLLDHPIHTSQLALLGFRVRQTRVHLFRPLLRPLGLEPLLLIVTSQFIRRFRSPLRFVLDPFTAKAPTRYTVILLLLAH